MNLSEIAPTKTNLLEFKDQLSFSQNGHSLLEQKREVLVMHLMDIISQIHSQREKLNKLLSESYEKLNIFRVEAGEHKLRGIIGGIPHTLRIEVVEKSIMGVAIPTIKIKQKREDKGKPIVSLSDTTASYDELQRKLSELLELMVLVAQTEVAAWRLSFEIKKTQRRVNALENVFIPEFKEIVKFIQDTLEERERETFFQMKRVKKAQQKKEADKSA